MSESASIILSDSISVGIIAGGESKRWGGSPKALLPFGHQRLIDCVIERLNAYPLLGVCVRPDQSWTDQLGLPLCQEDEVFPVAGPLVGYLYLLKQLQITQYEWLLVAPCDMPYLPIELGQQLSTKAQTSGALSAVLCDAEGDHSSVMLLHRTCYPLLRQFIMAGNARLRDWLTAHHSVRYIWQGDPLCLANLNSPAVLQSLAVHEAV